ncbi:hypothetical protein ACLZX5_14405 [Enterococcus faecium]|uniref:Uncharacterized protein n=2 Tax=Enterococcus gallinarum TaxID=1353 RepID=A0AAE7MR03_ENTGA|nr:hypothetical protein [Enterococcus gallinarum]MBO6419160.1 hypothetical protein [Enterococcus gallinarum]MBO6420295.1 hypothetical protein [Enterococcus gallinarum]QOG28065.1 hypothetical protein EGM181_12770 [Enterococcus gallinarum]RBT41868.1 hypothetical protein EB54_01208 [Enterococcus gallinarum]ROY67891.1 hypothetical protein EGW90_17160 [Enterococcus gallinarum]
MMDYIATNYDTLMQDETSHVFPNILSDDIQEVEDPSAHWNEDDNGTTVYESDWLFIGYRMNKCGTRNKFVLHHENFLEMIDDFGADSIIMPELRIVSGKDWLKQRQEELFNEL